MNKISDFVKKNKKSFAGGIVVVLILVWAFWYGGNAPGARGFRLDTRQEATSEQSSAENTVGSDSKNSANDPSDTLKGPKDKVPDKKEDGANTSEKNSAESTSGEAATSEAASSDEPEKQTAQGHEDEERSTAEGTSADTTEKTNTTTESQTTEKPTKINPTTEDTASDIATTESKPSEQVTTESPVTSEQEIEGELTCTISIDCTTVLDNMEFLAPEKTSLIPDDGVILSAVTVHFSKGDTVFDVLLKACKKYGIHLDYTWTPVYDSHYIEGIYNLYEFDCGNLSGWSYSVNGVYPSFGCSKYELSDGDVIAWRFTCDLGNDIGGGM